ncbi:Uncharacterized mitochondrial protein AtMg00300, partial [Striga hermonthica]
RNLDIVLIPDEYKFVLTTHAPAPLSAQSTEEKREAHRKWHKADEMARCYILASMSNVLQQQHHTMPTAADMMLSLKELFGEQDRAARFEAMRKIMSSVMPEGASVREHVLRMMEYLNEIDVLGGNINGEAKIDIILHSLPKSYENFCLNAIMNKKGYTLAELLTDLVAAEGLMRRGPQAHVSVQARSFSSKGGKKKKQVQKKGGGTSGSSGSGGSKAVAPSGGVVKPKGKCFKCNKTGHWKSDFIFNDNIVIMINNSFICSGMLVNNLYTITCAYHAVTEAHASSSLNKRKEPSQSNQTYLWHLRLGHVNLWNIQRLVGNGFLDSLQVEPFPVCESCLEGKMTSRPFKAKGNRSNDVLELIHSDLCGSMSIQARGGFEYFVTFIDDYSRYGYIYLMGRKSECFDKFKEFKAEAENLQGKSIKSLRSDR